MDKINSLSYLTDFTVTDKIARSASDWYTIQYKTLDGSKQIIRNEDIQWLFSQGWEPNASKVDENGDGYDTGSDNTRKVYLQRTVLNAETALNELIEDLIEAYNDGREINDTRYDDILSLYQASLDDTEDEMNVHETREDAVYTALATEIDNYIADYTTHETDAEDVYDSWGTATTNDITDRYDARVAAQKQDQIDRGWYDSSRWNQVETSINNEEDKELLDLAQRKIEIRDALKHRLYALKAQAHDRMVAARTRLDAQLAGQRNQRVIIRNRVIEAINRFAERRTDSYPELTEVNKIVKELGSAKPAGYKTP